ncbi:site-2 protease family protein [uncultured Cyclobacterium sp.]|uniref:site-2 protease family protein n=1 Tax=uncultured Cyclobacterium sp. TaxID=453820 RepID=UPI0030EDF3F0|tara:strand:- start:152439 stop:153122 length:684 start_codon:yes stop_codon:yes gene_type:complete
MFEFSDIPKFFLAFFLVLPIISILHEGGHVFFAWLMGGKNIRLSVGSGRPIFNWGMVEIRKYYFWYGLCTFENLKKNKKWSSILIFGGGSIFNMLGIIAIFYLIEQEFIAENMFTYQFTYFSFYYIFFALLPMAYPDGNYSDGKVIYDLLRDRSTVINEKTFTVRWDVRENHWQVLNHVDDLVQTFVNENEAYDKARELARLSKPSRIVYLKEGEEKEIHNFPKIPL